MAIVHLEAHITSEANYEATLGRMVGLEVSVVGQSATRVGPRTGLPKGTLVIDDAKVTILRGPPKEPVE